MIQSQNVYLDFLNHLNAAGVRYAVLHDWEALARGKTSDVDLVLAKEDLPRFELSFHSRYHVLNLLRYEASGFGFVLLPIDHDPDSAFVVDATTDYRWRGRVFFTGRDLLEGRQRWNGFWVAGPRQEYPYLLVKKIYEKGAIPEHQKSRLGQLAQELGPDGKLVISQLFGRTWGERLNNWIAQGQWTEIEAHIAPLRSCLRRQVVKRDRFNQLKYWLPEIRRIWQRWRFPTGLAVGVVGPDETERTLLIEHLAGMFPGAFRGVAILPGAPGLFTRDTSFGPACSARPKTSLQGWFSRLKRLCHRVDFTLGLLLRVRPLLVGSTLVLYRRSAESLWAGLPDLSCTISLEGPRWDDKATRSARDILSNHLIERYLSRCQIWFPNPHA